MLRIFFNGLVAGSPKAVPFTGFAAQLETKATTPDTIPQIASKFCERVGSNLADKGQCKNFNERLAISTEECGLLEERTRGQSSSQEWIEQSKDRVTGSQVHRVTHKVDEMVKKRKATVTPLLDLLINGGGGGGIEYLPFRWEKITTRELLKSLKPILSHTMKTWSSHQQECL
ncbi:hypothetical protein ElyMa_002177800 [Elysia marginata]|uniref:Uncharacterized protein n=1 Tax=Elysia marginata TaxID=1093978 RepID=A0AAV4FNW0_9GAST|nr:hypothetical protein ElyMa_002177800 [Elysia marginata]